MIYYWRCNRAVNFRGQELPNQYAYKIYRHYLCIRGELYSDFSESSEGFSGTDGEGSSDSSNDQRDRAAMRSWLAGRIRN